MAQKFEFNSVEIFDDANRELGWDIEYRQLKPDPFQVSFLVDTFDDCIITIETFTGTVEVAAAPSTDNYALIIPTATGYGGRFNSKIIDDSSAYLIAPGADFQACVKNGGGAIAILVPSVQFEMMAQLITPQHPLPAAGSFIPLSISSSKFVALRQRLEAHSANTDLASTLTDTNIAEAVVRLAAQKRADVKKREIVQKQIVFKAREYLSDQLASEVSLSELCRYTDVGSRRLERAFQREFGMPPMRYLMSRRLNSVRRALVNSNSAEVNVSDVAHKFGFKHMGRFSAEYKNLFREYPSNSLHK